MATATVLYSENNYSDDSVERRIYGPDVRVIFPAPSASLADLSDEDCAAAEGLMILRFKVNARDLKRFPRLRAICRMGVGYDNLDRVADTRPLKLGLGGGDHRLQVPEIGGVGIHLGGDHDLLLVAGRLCVIALHVPARGLHVL